MINKNCLKGDKMGEYRSFAYYYDILTENVDYISRTEYICELMKKYNHKAGLLLDLACGTGSITLELAKKGIDVFGIDASSNMLSIARQKAIDRKMDILFLCQKMQDIDLFGTVDTVVCTLDSINHLIKKEDILKTFQRVSLFLNKKGYFIFDANTIYKHEFLLADNVFVYDTHEVFCVWQNEIQKADDIVKINLDFFVRENDVYLRESEEFYERAYCTEEISSMLIESGFEIKGVYNDMSFEKPQKNSERLIFVAEKI